MKELKKTLEIFHFQEKELELYMADMFSGKGILIQRLSQAPHQGLKQL